MRFSLDCSEHEDSTIDDDQADNASVTAMGSGEFELDVSEVRCSVWCDLDEDDQQDESNNCTIVVTTAS